MDTLLLAFGGFAGAFVTWLFLRGSGREVRSSVPPPVEGGIPAAPPIVNPLLLRLNALRDEVAGSPRVWRPDDLAEVAPFRALIDAFDDPAVDVNTRLTFWECDDAILSWGALCSLARTPRDEAIEERLLAAINRHHPWCRHFLLRVLEEWNPGNALLATVVLFRLDDSWNRDEMGVVLDQFLRRRAAIAPIELDGTSRPAGFDEEDLITTLRRQVDPAIAGQIIRQLCPETEPAEAAAGGGTASSNAAPPHPLGGLGRVRRPGSVREERAIGCPSVDAGLERALAALTGSPRRPVLIVGEAGVGKSSLIRRLAARLSAEEWTILEAEAGDLNAGMLYVGALEERLRVLRAGLARPRTLWIAPNFHQLLWSGRHNQSPVGILEMIIPALESGEMLIVGETRPESLERVLAERPEVRRLFEIVRIAPPSEAEIVAMLEEWSRRTSVLTHVGVPVAVRAEATGLARQYLSSQAAPGGVFRLLEGALEEAVIRAGAGSATAMTVDDLVMALARLTGLPLEILDERRPLDLDAVRRHFDARVIGQPEAARCLVERLALLKAGITDPTRPTGVFLFAGASGTGKTEMAKTLADFLFGAPDRLVRLDMSELQDIGSLERVFGSGTTLAAPGHSLAERVRRQPFCVVLLDEVEKAHPRVWDVFLQVFDDGRLTDPRGETTDFRQAIIILTSNLGTATAGETRLGLVGGAGAFSPATIERAVEREFRPEFRNRLDRIVVFQPLRRDVMRLILRKELADAFARRGLRRREWAVELEESAIELLVERGFSPTLGARPLKRALEQLLLSPLAAAIVDRRAPEGDQFLFVRADGEGLAVEFVDPDAGTPRGATAIQPAGEVAAIAFEARGSRTEIDTLHAALAGILARVGAEDWRSAKESLLLETAAPGFWERPDRFERLGRAEYLDRIENAARSTASLLERIEGPAASSRESYPRDVVRRLAQQLHLLEAASREAVAEGPRDAFVAVEPVLDDTAPSAPTRDFARRIAAMYAAWARARGMRLATLESPAADAAKEPRHVLAIAGFAALAFLQTEDGLHVLEWEEPGARGPRRVTARVRVVAQPAEPPRDLGAGLRRQASEALAAHGGGLSHVARRYRDGSSPLVRDAARGWRTGRLDRVLAGDFDLIPSRE